MRIALTIFVLFITQAQANTYDWVKTRVNKFWYDQYFEKCLPRGENKSSKKSLPLPFANSSSSIIANSDSAHCSRISLFENPIPEINAEVKESLFFDKALNDQALENQCQYDYWNRLNSSKHPEIEKKQASSNEKLRTQFKNLKANLKDFPDPLSPSTEQNENPNSAQAKIIDQLTEQSLKIAELRREITQIAATNPVYSTVGSAKGKDKILKLEQQIQVLESSMIFSEDHNVKDYVNAVILPKIGDYYKTGKKINSAELKDYFLNDDHESFQKRVVEFKLKSIANKQMSYANIDGKYNDNYNFKVQAVQEGAGARILNQPENQNAGFSSIQCEIESKYGKGEKAATNTNTAIISGLTVMFGGASFALARLSQIGIVSLRAAKIASTLSSVVNGSISATMLAEGIIDACFENHFAKNDHSICSRAEEQIQKGINAQISAEISQSVCLRDLGLSALAGFTSYKSFIALKKLQREKQLIDLGLKARHEQILSNLSQNTELASSDKTKIINEINKALKLSTENGFPRDSFIQAMAKESPEDLYMALKQINNEHAGATWTEKVKKWLERNGVKGSAAQEMQSCLIDQGDKVVSHCPLEKINRMPN